MPSRKAVQKLQDLEKPLEKLKFKLEDDDTPPLVKKKAGAKMNETIVLSVQSSLEQGDQDDYGSRYEEDGYSEEEDEAMGEEEEAMGEDDDEGEESEEEEEPEPDPPPQTSKTTKRGQTVSGSKVKKVEVKKVNVKEMEVKVKKVKVKKVKEMEVKVKQVKKAKKAGMLESTKVATTVEGAMSILDMILVALNSSTATKKGIGLGTIKKNLKEKFPDKDWVKLNTRVKKSMLQGLEAGSILRAGKKEMNGLRGSFVINKVQPPSNAPKTAATNSSSTAKQKTAKTTKAKTTEKKTAAKKVGKETGKLAKGRDKENKVTGRKAKPIKSKPGVEKPAQKTNATMSSRQKT